MELSFRCQEKYGSLQKANHIGEKLKLDSGEHVIRALFANGGHVPYSPAITSKVTVTVK